MRNLTVIDTLLYGDGIYGHRYFLSQIDKEQGNPTTKDTRHNTLTGFLYFWGNKSKILYEPENIVFKNCVFKNMDRLYCQPLSDHCWCSGLAPKDITFIDCQISDIRKESYINANIDTRTHISLINCHITSSKEINKPLFILGNNVELKINNTILEGYQNPYIEILESSNSKVINSQIDSIDIRYIKDINIDAY